MIQTKYIFESPSYYLEATINEELEKLQKKGYSIIDIKINICNEYPWALIIYNDLM